MNNIPMFLEVKRHFNGDYHRKNGKWISVDKWTHILSSEIELGEQFVLEVKHEDCIFKQQNDDLFVLLTGVGHSPGITPQYEPKGLPDNANQLIKYASRKSILTGHSHSYLTLRELLEIDWDRLHEVTGFKRTEYEIIQAYGDKVVSISPSTNGIGFTYKYVISYRERFSHFMEVIEHMKTFLITSGVKTANVVTEDDIRIVFWTVKWQ